MKKFFRNFLLGRYGPDYLGNTMAITAAAILLLSLLFRVFWLAAAFLLPLAAEVYRFLSKDIKARRKENDRFVCLVWPLKTKIGQLLRKILKKKKNER